MNLPATVNGAAVSIIGEYEVDLLTGARLREAAEALQFMLGDWVLAMQERYEESVNSLATDMSKATGVPANSLREYARVAKVFGPDKRLSGSSWSHHQAAASADTPLTTLNIAAAESLSVRDTKRLAQGLPTGGEDTAKAQSSVVVTGASLEEAALEALGLAESHLQRALDTMNLPGFRLTVNVGQDLKTRLEAVSKPFLKIEARIDEEVGAFT